MNTTELIEIARECFDDVEQDEQFPWQATNKGLQKFAKRIEAPHKQRIAELEKDCEILQTNLDAALMQVKQLREALQSVADKLGYEWLDKDFDKARHILESTQ